MKELIKKFLPQKIINMFWHLPIAVLANIKYGFPSRNLSVIGVTGTDGKTTTVNMIYQILKNSGKKVSMVSTINASVGGKEIDTGFHVTSPDPIQVQKLIKKSIEHDDQYIVLEVTSHALDQYRFWGIKFNIGVITNITHEHLDYHKTWNNYFKAKAKLVMGSELGVMSRDEKHFKKLSQLSQGKIISFGLSKDADFNPNNFQLKLKIPGEFNILNALASAAVCINLGIERQEIINSLEHFETLTGRMQEIPNEPGSTAYKKNLKIIIDFAHTPNALKNSLKTLKTKYKGRLTVVFGCAGLRDEEKRPIMGEIATKLADKVIITAEDPRGKLDEINLQILEGVYRAHGKLGENVLIEEDRGKAIKLAISMAKKGDIIGIFGKGHEKSMNLNGLEEIPWSDYKAVKEAFYG